MTTPKPHIAHTLLTRAHSPGTADTLFTERIKQRPLFLRPTSPTPEDNRNRRRLHRLRKKEYFLRKQKPKPLSAREKRTTGVHDLRPEECKYDIFRGLHAMWVEYMQEIMDLKDHSNGQGQPPVTSLSHGSKLVSADFHGAEIEVVKSRCSGRVGLKGIVVRDTKFTFLIVTKDDKVKTIPKEQTVVRFCVPLPTPTDADEDTVMTQDDNDKDKQPSTSQKDLVFEIHGSQFQNRPVDRAHKKFKWKNVEYL